LGEKLAEFALLWDFFYNAVESLLDEIAQVTDSGKETIIDTRTEKERQLDSDWETEQE